MIPPGIPLLAVYTAGELPAPLRAVVEAAASWFMPCAYDAAAAPRFAAALVADLRLIDLPPDDLPVCLWIEDPSDAADAIQDSRVRAVASASEDDIAAAGPLGVLLPRQPVVFEGARAVPPFVRARLRSARGLPQLATATVGVGEHPITWCGSPIGPELLDTALASAGAVAVRGPTLVRALAWGAPCVTDPESAAHVGAADVAVVSRRGDLEQEAQVLAEDLPRAAALSRTGRSHYEQRFDPATAARALAAALGLVPTGTHRVAALLDELGARPDDDIAHRLHELLRPLLSGAPR